MTKRLEGQTIFVTGAGAGIGLGILKALVSEGAVAYGLDFMPEAVATIREAGGRPITVDVTNAVAFVQAINDVRGQSGRLDGLVNNAGQTLTQPFLEADIALWDRLWQVNQRPVLVGAQAAARIMVADGRKGAIVNVASVHAAASDLSYEGYAGTKGPCWR
ncbi:SDR family NAD(P)-dependent oxidoreductase [Shinella sp. 838]|nr:SDR family NAD(P)-dependent oxidoreductase [Shinella sp. 838]MDG4674917.1 SDR family NAD(P)-dependent oxidoreductase [Shinella sp. 838]